MLRRGSAPWLLALLLGCSVVPGLLAARSAVAAGEGYPRLGIYGGINGDGTPFYHAPADSALDPIVLNQYARYDQIILDVNPITPYRPDVLAELRARHPGLRALGYITANEIWPAADVDSLRHFPTRYRRLVRDLDGFLYNAVNGAEFPHSNVNLAKRDAQGHFVVAERLADLFHEVVAGAGIWDGVFLDECCADIWWMENATQRFDFVRAGYPTRSSFLAAWAEGSDTLAYRLRRLAGPDWVIVGNCGTSSHHAVFNGWMREDFPFQRAGTWFDNMLRDPHGYLADDRDYQQPPQNYLSSWMRDADGQQYTSTNVRKARFGLGSAALGEGYGVFALASGNINTVRFYQWWYDEYAVDVTSGRAMNGLPYTHWLGQALAGPYQMVWVGTNPDACTNPGFESSVTSGWNFGLFAPAAATIERDTLGAADGHACAHITITAAGINPWDVNLTTANALGLTAGNRYSATFWARASSPRIVPVVATLLTGGETARQNVALGTEWRRYQAVLTPSSTVSAKLEFFLGTEAGEVWFDDVHFQAGETSLWRRDFENGIVLVNPGAVSMQVPLGAGFRHILGTVDPNVNHGGPGTTATVPPSDALFLIGAPRDTTPPDPIGDARVQP